MEKMSSIIRREFKKGDDIRDAGLTAPDDVIRYKDIAYGKDSAMQVLDVYRPKDTEGNLPVIVSVHGGGWVYGDKELYQYYCMSIAQRGFALVNFTYRLAPEYQFPAPMEDTNSVFAWILDNKDKYGRGESFCSGRFCRWTDSFTVCRYLYECRVCKRI